jgi:glycosyltransferase involved in cell wall biosynthesis
MCPTFGRVALLEESIECFLRQDYEGKIELIILNDLVGQTLSITDSRINESREIRIINMPERFDTLGEKRNAGAEFSRYEWIMTWGDDDIHLPWEITEAIGWLQNNDKEIGFLGNYFFDSGGKTEIRLKQSLPGPFLMKKECFVEIGGISEMNCGEDASFLLKAHKSKRKAVRMDCRPGFIYRWGTGHYHISGLGPDKEGKVSGYIKIGEWMQKAMSDGKIPSGEVQLKPHLDKDWVKVCEALEKSSS